MRATNVSLASVLALMGCYCPIWQGLADPAPPPPPQDAPRAAQKNDAKPATFDALCDSIAQTVRNGQTKDLDISGFAGRGPKFRDSPAEGGLLIGMHLSAEDFGGRPALSAMRPIYRTKAGEKLGAWICKDVPPNPTILKAKDGYVVGAINIKTSAGIDGISLRFVKLDNNRLKLDDHYTSELVGDHTGGSKSIGGNGVLIAGIVGSQTASRQPGSLGVMWVPQP